MKTNQRKPFSAIETILIVLTLSSLWGGFINFGQILSPKGFFVLSWKWLAGSTLIAFTLFALSLFSLLIMLDPLSKTGKIYGTLKEQLARRPILSLLFSFLILGFSVLIYLSHRLRDLLGFNLFTHMLLWLFLLPVIIFLFFHFKDQKKYSVEQISGHPKNEAGSIKLPLEKLTSLHGRWNLLWMSTLIIVYLVSFFTPWNLYSISPWLAILIFLALAFLVGIGLGMVVPHYSQGARFIGSIIFFAAGAAVAGFFSQVSNNPFALSWSEGTWIFNGSLIFSKSIYGIHLNPPIQYANRAILQSIPFALYRTAPIWVHRVWQALLWSILPIVFGILFSKRLGLAGLWRVVFISWIFLFLQQGPIYYFLFLAPILIFLARKTSRFWIPMLLVSAASVWIGIDRINWYPLPGCLMTLLYLFEAPYSGKFWSYWWKPVVWILGGILVASAARFGWWTISGYPASYFFTFTKSSLLAYRLLPNSTNPIGILPLISLVILPISSVLLAHLNLAQKNMHWSRRWVLLGILLVFFMGDILVSVKIGGGNNLHNFDAFMLLLLVSASYFFFRKVILDQPIWVEPVNVPKWLVGLIALIPVVITFNPTSIPSITKSEITSAMNEVNRAITLLPSDAKPVLFINETQLLSTGQVKNVMPVPAYEMELMMEMAMANNTDYLHKLYSDLSNQRFSLIIAPELNVFQKGSEWAFGEENDAWNSAISVPVLRYYHPILIRKDFGFEILIPNGSTGN